MARTVLGMGGKVVFMNWLWWTLIGIVVFAVVLFFISCAWLSHYLDGHDEHDDEQGGWY